MDMQKVEEFVRKGDYPNLINLIATIDDENIKDVAVKGLRSGLANKYSRERIIQNIHGIDKTIQGKLIEAFIPRVLDAVKIPEFPYGLEVNFYENSARNEIMDGYAGLINALAILGGEKVIDTIGIIAFQSNNSRIKDAAVGVLGTIADPRSINTFFAVMQQDHVSRGSFQSMASEALIKMSVSGKLLFEFLITSINNKNFQYFWIENLFKYLKTTNFLTDNSDRRKMAEVLSAFLENEKTSGDARKRLELFNLEPTLKTRTQFLNRLYLLSWYYQGEGGEIEARKFFEKLREGVTSHKNFPFSCQYQVGLVHCTVDTHWAVGTLVMGGADEGDSSEQINLLHKWFEECGADSTGTDRKNERVRVPSVEGTLQSQYGSHYKCIEKFGTL